MIACRRPVTDAVRIIDPDPTWPGRAETALAEIGAVLGPAVVHAEHIGRTSIPGMAAKNVLDLQLSVVDLRPSSGPWPGSAPTPSAIPT